jgi:hypothetical protein
MSINHGLSCAFGGDVGYRRSADFVEPEGRVATYVHAYHHWRAYCWRHPVNAVAVLD